MKVVNITVGPNGNIIALTAAGEIYNGNFISFGPFKKPEFQWRKLPPVDMATYVLPQVKEPTDEELRLAEVEQEKAAVASMRAQLKKQSWFKRIFK